MDAGTGATSCYWLEPNGLARVILRRFTFGVECPAVERGHDGQRVTAIEFPYETYIDEAGWVMQRGVPEGLVPPRTSRRWPRRCEACGGLFPRGAEWQAAVAQGFVRSDTGETVWVRHVMGRAMAGALHDSAWLRGAAGKHAYDVIPGADGLIVWAVCPNGAPWVIDGAASGGGRWTRTGDPRVPESFSVAPSIVAGDYHGFLQAGRFTDHIG